MILCLDVMDTRQEAVRRSGLEQYRGGGRSYKGMYAPRVTGASLFRSWGCRGFHVRFAIDQIKFWKYFKGLECIKVEAQLFDVS
jgi:hypothetical protein